MNTCKTCTHWKVAEGIFDNTEVMMCSPVDPDSHEPMQRGFEVRRCRQPQQTFCETPVMANGFGLADGSEYMAILVTGEDFGCVLHEPNRVVMG